MIGHVKAEHFALERQHVLAFPLGNVRHLDRERVPLGIVGTAHGEKIERELTVVLLLLLGDDIFHGLFVTHDQPAPGMTELIERAGLDHGFDGSLIADHRGNLGQEVVEGRETFFFMAGVDHGLHHVGTHIAHGSHAEPDVRAHGGEVQFGLVDVRWEHCDAHVATFGEVERQLVLVIAHGGEQRGHVLGRIVRLEICGPIGHQTVGRGVRLVERVVGEREQDVPQ